jgi:hypothetical protein
MHPLLRHEIARYRQVDMLREAARERLGHEMTLAGKDTTRRRFALRRRERPAFTTPKLAR